LIIANLRLKTYTCSIFQWKYKLIFSILHEVGVRRWESVVIKICQLILCTKVKVGGLQFRDFDYHLICGPGRSILENSNCTHPVNFHYNSIIMSTQVQFDLHFVRGRSFEPIFTFQLIIFFVF